MNKEPSLVFGFISALLALAVAYGYVAEAKAPLWLAFLLATLHILQAVLTRAKVMPVATINEAGLYVDQVKQCAADPRVTPVRED